MSLSSAMRRRVVAVAGVLALGAGGALVVAHAPAATAAPSPVATTSAPLKWGVKESFRTYITGIAAGSITVSEGAKRVANNEGGLTWPVLDGSYDAGTKAGTVNYGGKVVFRSVGHTIWHITIANPTLVLDGTANGKLYADVSYATGGSESAPANQGTDTDVFFGTVAVTTPTVNGQSSTYTNQAVTLTAEGSASFNGQYAAGTAMDPLTAAITLTAPPTTTPPTTTPPTTTPPTTPAPNPVTALVNSLVAALTALLAGLGG